MFANKQNVVVQADTKKKNNKYHVQSVTSKHFKYIPKITCTMYQVHSKTTGSCSSTCTCIYQKTPCSQPKKVLVSVYTKYHQGNNSKFKTTMMFAIHTLGVISRVA